MTRLTIPSAGTSPGRAAQAQPVEAGRSGEMIAQLGNVMAEIGGQLEADRLDRQMKRAQVDLTRDVNELRLDVERIGDPDQIEAAWQQGVAQLRARYTQPGEDGRARIDARNAEPFGLVFDQLTNSVAFDVGRRALGLRQSQREASWLSYSHEAVTAAAQANPETRAVILQHGDEQIDGLLAAGVIDPAEAERRRQSLRRDVDNERAIRMIEADPAGFIAAAQAGQFDGLPGEAVARYEVQASNALEREEAARATEQERQARERSAAVDARLRDMRDIYLSGRKVIDEAFLAGEEAQASDLYGEVLAARSLRDEGHVLAELAPRDIDALIAQEENRKLRAPWEAKRLEQLIEWRDRHREGYTSDPVAHRQSLDLGVTPLPEFDPRAPEPFLRAVEARRAEGQALVDQGVTDELRLFSDEERAEIQQLAGLEADPAARVALAQTLAAAGSGTADRVTSVVGDPVFTHVAGLMQAGASRNVAYEVLRGQKALADEVVRMPPARERTDAAFELVQGFFADLPAAYDMEASIVAAADALYAQRMRPTDPAGDIDERAYRQAVHEVMGGSGSYNSRNARGGLQEYNGQLTPMPVGLGARQVDDSVRLVAQYLDGRRIPIDRVGARETVLGDVPRVIEYHTTDSARAAGVDFLQAASVSGGVPIMQGQPIDADTLRDAAFRAVRPNVYVLEVGGRLLRDSETGMEFELDLRALVQAVQP